MSAPLRLFPTLSNPSSQMSSRARVLRDDYRELVTDRNVARPTTTAIQPAAEHIKHSLYHNNFQSTPADPHLCPSMGRSNVRSRSKSSMADTTMSVGADKLSSLPVTKSFSTTRSAMSKRPRSDATSVPTSKKNDAQAKRSEASHDNHEPSPHSGHPPLGRQSQQERDCLISHHAPRSTPRPDSDDDAQSSNIPRIGLQSLLHRSVFPQYDSRRPLSQQDYCPTIQIEQRCQYSKINAYEESTARPALQRRDSAVALADAYGHIPIAESADLLRFADRSCVRSLTVERKVRLDLSQSPDSKHAVTIGRSAREPLYTMETAEYVSSSGVGHTLEQLAIHRHVAGDGVPTLVAQLMLPTSTPSESNSMNEHTSVFPQAAAYDAIQTAVNSPAAFEIASFDPQGLSPDATRLAVNAVEEAREMHACELRRTAKKRVSFGAMDVTYYLAHPSNDLFAVTATNFRLAPTGVISGAVEFSNPAGSATTVAAGGPVLARLDFTNGVCIVDTPALLALDTPYIIDVCISSMLAVAAREIHALRAAAGTFPPPPRATVESKRCSVLSSTLSKLKKAFRHSKGIVDAPGGFVGGEQVDLPRFPTAALLMLGLSVRTMGELLKAGYKNATGTTVLVRQLAHKA